MSHLLGPVRHEGTRLHCSPKSDRRTIWSRVSKAAARSRRDKLSLSRSHPRSSTKVSNAVSEP